MKIELAIEHKMTEREHTDKTNIVIQGLWTLLRKHTLCTGLAAR